MKNRFVVLTLSLAGVAALAGAQDKAGSVTTKLAQAQAYQENGSPAPTKNAACVAKYKQYFGQAVVNDYSILPNSQTAKATFLGTPTQLYPMGLSSSYSFISDGIPAPLKKTGLMRIIFQLNKQFGNPRNMLMFPLETGYNCVVSNGLLEDAEAPELLTGKPQK